MRSRRFVPQWERMESRLVCSVTVDATALQAEIAQPVLNVNVSALATGQAAKARNIVVVNELVHFGLQVQVVLVGAGGQGSGSTDVSALATQEELAAPTVDLTAQATATGDHALALNIIIINLNIWFGNQTQMVRLGSGGPGSTSTVDATATQVEVADPTVDLVELANASGSRAVAVNRITVTANVYLGNQTATTTLPGAGVNLAGLVNVTSTATQLTSNDPTANVTESSQTSGLGAQAQNRVKVTEQVRFGPQLQVLAVGSVSKLTRGSLPGFPRAVPMIPPGSDR